MTESTVHVQLDAVGKHFGGVQAVLDVTLAFYTGQVHALVGENGAGKSTVGKMIAGVHRPDSGVLHVSGRAVSYRSPRDALRDGITIIAQEMSLVPHRSVLENVFLGTEHHSRGLVRERSMRAAYKELIADAGFSVPRDAVVGRLRTADQQKVEILRALARGADLIVMDEPTATLTSEEASQLVETVKLLRQRGTTIIYVSHFLQEVLEVADVVSVMRDGRLVETRESIGTSTEMLVTSMLGRSMDTAFPAKAFPPRDAPVVLSVNNLTAAPRFEDVSFNISAGEIIGFAGLVGAGRSEVARAIFGADRYRNGQVCLDGDSLRNGSPRRHAKSGMAMIPESRKTQGLHMSRSVTDNSSLVHVAEVSRAGWVARARERRRANEILTRVSGDSSRLNVRVSTLSGGNQQKVLFAKWLFKSPRLLIVDEPTRGIDVGAKKAIYDLIRELADGGMAMLLISSELEEIIGLSHRVLVMRAGRIRAELQGDEITEERVVRAAFGMDNRNSETELRQPITVPSKDGRENDRD